MYDYNIIFHLRSFKIVKIGIFIGSVGSGRGYLDVSKK